MPFTFPAPILDTGFTRSITYLGASEAPTISGSTFTVTGATLGSGYTHILVAVYGVFSTSRTWTGAQVGTNFETGMITSPSATLAAGMHVVPHPGTSTGDIALTASGTGGVRGCMMWWGINILSATPLSTATDTTASANALDTGSKTVSGPLIWAAYTGCNSTTSLTVTWSQGTEDRDVLWGSRTASGASSLDSNGLSAETISATYSGAPSAPGFVWGAWS